MATFMQNLAANPSGTGIYGMPGPQSITPGDALSIVNAIKDREMRDFQNKAQYMSNLSIQQDRMRRVYGLDSPPGEEGTSFTGYPTQRMPDASGPGGAQNVVMAQDPNQITAAQKAELGIRQGQLEQQKAALAQRGKLGQEAIDVRTAQEKLNQQKSDQIRDQKQAELEAKINKTQADHEMNVKRLQDANINAQDRIKILQDTQKSMEAYHNAVKARDEQRHQDAQDKMKSTIDYQNRVLQQRGRSRTTTEISPEGTKKTVTTERGPQTSGIGTAPRRNSDGTYHVVGPDGKEYDVPADKLDDWNSNHQPEQEEQDQNQGGDEGAAEGDEG